MFKRTTTGLDTQLTTQQQRLSLGLRNAMLLPIVAAVSTIKEMGFQYHKFFKTLKLSGIILMF
jgi:hypothetical protein